MTNEETHSIAMQKIALIVFFGFSAVLVFFTFAMILFYSFGLPGFKIPETILYDLFYVTIGDVVFIALLVFLILFNNPYHKKALIFFEKYKTMYEQYGEKHCGETDKIKIHRRGIDAFMN